MKYSSKFETDYNFYLNNIDIFKGIGFKECRNSFDDNGYSAKECFYNIDSFGEYLPCKEIDLLKKLLNCKASVNLQIKQWSEGVADFTISINEVKEYLTYYQCPDWVLKAIVNQSSKIISKMNDEDKKQNLNLVLIHSLEL